MILKGAKQLKNFKKGINLYVPKRIVSAAPSGIPVATTNEIIVTDPEGVFTGNYLKDGQGNGGYQPLGGDNGLFYNGGWYFYNSDSGRTRSHPTATDPNFIPETGWQDAITITAA
jgi:hypothetical protein